MAVGYDADSTLIGLQETRTISDDWVVRKCRWTPFNGIKATGWPMATILRGSTIMCDRAVQDSLVGILVRF
jgi:dihydroorotase